MKIDILVFVAHPDDVELGCGGTVIKLVEQGKKVAIIDLTRGELGTRGTAENRKEECENATKILGVAMRENMDFKDGFFKDDEKHKLFPVVSKSTTIRDCSPGGTYPLSTLVPVIWPLLNSIVNKESIAVPPDVCIILKSSIIGGKVSSSTKSEIIISKSETLN